MEVEWEFFCRVVSQDVIGHLGKGQKLEQTLVYAVVDQKVVDTSLWFSNWCLSTYIPGGYEQGQLFLQLKDKIDQYLSAQDQRHPSLGKPVWLPRYKVLTMLFRVACAMMKREEYREQSAYEMNLTLEASNTVLCSTCPHAEVSHSETPNFTPAYRKRQGHWIIQDAPSRVGRCPESTCPARSVCVLYGVRKYLHR